MVDPKEWSLVASDVQWRTVFFKVDQIFEKIIKFFNTTTTN